jgi:hypothetical protein
MAVNNKRSSDFQTKRNYEQLFLARQNHNSIFQEFNFVVKV